MSAEDTAPRRLTPSEKLHEVTMAYATRQASPPEQGCEVTRNAKGVAQFTVTVRGHDLDAVIAQARAAYVQLDDALPYPLEGAQSPQNGPEPPDKPATAARAQKPTRGRVEAVAA